MRILTTKMADSERELLPLPGSKSVIWAFFGFPAKDGQFIEQDKRKRKEVICKTCRKEFAYTGSTTNLISHLRNNHTKEYTTMTQQSSEGLKELLSTASKPLQRQLKDSFAAHSPLPHSTTRWKKLTEAVCYYIAKDMLPLDTVSSEGFLQMVNEFEPRYKPPSRKALTTHYLPRLYQQQLDQVKASLSDSRYSVSFAMTTDINLVFSCK